MHQYNTVPDKKEGTVFLPSDYVLGGEPALWIAAAFELSSFALSGYKWFFYT
jgi:hypothetical protein